MDKEVSISLVQNASEPVIDLIQNSYTQISQILNLPEYIQEKTDHIDEFLEELDEYPPREKLQKEVIEECQRFIQTILKQKTILSDEYDPKDTSKLSKLFKVRSLMSEQLWYLYTNPEKIECEVYFLYATLNGLYYGAAFAFWNKERRDILFMQGICKSFIASLIEIYYPEYKFPKLNSLLQPAIESLANKLGSTTIMVVPIGKQGDILEKHYGYLKKNEEAYYPCKEILGSDYHSSDPKIYIKEL